MPTIELLAEVQALKEKNKELAEHVVFWVADSKEQWTRAERATHMASLWKRCAKRWKMDCEDNYSECEDLKIELKQLVGQNNRNLDDFHDAYMKLTLELAALKKDARHVAKYLKLKAMTVPKETFEKAQEAAHRILEATKKGA